MGDSIPDFSETLPWRGRGKVSDTYDFSEGGYVQSDTHCGRGLLLVTAVITVNGFSAFLETQELGS